MVNSRAANKKPPSLTGRVWKGKDGKTKTANDSQAFSNVTNATISALGGNDILSISLLDQSLVQLGEGNDQLTIAAFGKLKAPSTIDGGGGIDIVSLGYLETSFTWSWDTTKNVWIMKAGGRDYATVKGVEKFQFKNNVAIELDDANHALTIVGSDRADSLSASTNGSNKVSVRAGLGDDVIAINSIDKSGNTPISVDGGAGNDTIKLTGIPNDYIFSKDGDTWQIDYVDGLNHSTVLIAQNVENLTLSDGSTIAFVGDGINFKAGNKAVGCVGTTGNDTLTGSRFDDTFVHLGGNDIFDLTKGGRDGLVFARLSYIPVGDSNVEVIGYQTNDNIKIVDPFQIYTVIDNTRYENGYRTGDYHLDAGLSGSVNITFSAPKAG